MAECESGAVRHRALCDRHERHVAHLTQRIRRKPHERIPKQQQDRQNGRLALAAAHALQRYCKFHTALCSCLGAKLVVDASATDPAAFIPKEIGGVHGVLFTAVSRSTFAQALGMVRRGGTVSLNGLPPGDFPLPIFSTVLNGITVCGSIVGTRRDLQESLDFVAQGLIHANHDDNAMTLPSCSGLTPPSPTSPDSAACPHPCHAHTRYDTQATAAAPRAESATAVHSVPASGSHASPRR